MISPIRQKEEGYWFAANNKRLSEGTDGGGDQNTAASIKALVERKTR